MRCSIEGCENKYLCKGFCNKHYQRFQVHGDPLKVIERVRPKCSVGGCNNLNFANTYCHMHNRRNERHGDPLFINPKCNRDGKYRERHKGYQKQWRKDNWDYYRAYLNSHNRRRKCATPKWADMDAIKKFYLNCPKGYHVDHIVPLNGKKVSGLHVIENLQYLPAKDNLRKSNKF